MTVSSLEILPLSLLKSARGQPISVELTNGETYNGDLVDSNALMNIHLRGVICTSKDGDRLWCMPECYIYGNTIMCLRIPNEGKNATDVEQEVGENQGQHIKKRGHDFRNLSYD
ncbi:sm-like protein LSM4 [Trifolium pratense]|uniref:sm-like protein LSM4 n=1 Tax=Trifolium pratense TaxID=57577 RepID=UPI001E696143|nr:sm-like protein LSM4 [Trifolium pratense]